jgi:hypothetical protein
MTAPQFTADQVRREAKRLAGQPSFDLDTDTASAMLDAYAARLEQDAQVAAFAARTPVRIVQGRDRAGCAGREGAVTIRRMDDGRSEGSDRPSARGRPSGNTQTQA